MRQVILNFHGIGTPARALEPDEDAYWVTPDFFLETLDLVKTLSDQARVSFTFDDGNASDLAIAAEPLATKAHHAQFFVLSSRLDTPGSLGTDDLKTLQDMGHSIGSHGADHVSWRALDDAGKQREFDTAREQISAAAGRPIDSAAIPFGRYDAHVIKSLRKRGYSRVYSSHGGTWQDGQYPIPRTSPRADMTIQDIENTILGREPKAKTLRRAASIFAKRWV